MLLLNRFKAVVEPKYSVNRSSSCKSLKDISDISGSSKIYEVFIEPMAHGTLPYRPKTCVAKLPYGENLSPEQILEKAPNCHIPKPRILSQQLHIQTIDSEEILHSRLNTYKGLLEIIEDVSTFDSIPPAIERYLQHISQDLQIERHELNDRVQFYSSFRERLRALAALPDIHTKDSIEHRFLFNKAVEEEANTHFIANLRSKSSRAVADDVKYSSLTNWPKRSMHTLMQGQEPVIEDTTEITEFEKPPEHSIKRNVGLSITSDKKTDRCIQPLYALSPKSQTYTAEKNEPNTKTGFMDCPKHKKKDETKEPTKNPLRFQIPKTTMAKILLSTSKDEKTYWQYTLYQGPEGEKVKIHYCKSKETTERVAKLFLNQTVIGFDIEWKPQASASDGIRNNVALIQLASEERIALFHIARYAKGDKVEDLVSPALQKVMELSTITKVGVSIKGDSTRLRNFMGIDSKGMFELSYLYKLVKYFKDNPGMINKKPVSLAQQVKEHLHLPLWKGDVRYSDWSAELDYAQIQCMALSCNYEKQLISL